MHPFFITKNCVWMFLIVNSIPAWNYPYFVLNFKSAFSVSLTVYVSQKWKGKLYLFLWLFTKRIKPVLYNAVYYVKLLISWYIDKTILYTTPTSLCSLAVLCLMHLGVLSVLMSELYLAWNFLSVILVSACLNLHASVT